MLDTFSDEQLQTEMERRQKIKEADEKPKPLQVLDTGPLQKICKDYIEELSKEGRVDDDFDNYIFETAMVTVYGKDVWEWINKQGE